MWKFDMLDKIISVTVMKVSSPTLTDATKKAFPPLSRVQREQIRLPKRSVLFKLPR